MIRGIIGSDTFVLYDRVFRDFADGDIVDIAFPNSLSEIKTGKDKNTIFAKNETGSNADVTIRIIKGSDDDVFLNKKMNSQIRDFASFELANGQLVKNIGDGEGGVRKEINTLKNGVFVTKPVSKNNTEGDTEQGVAVYVMKFASAERTIE